MQLIVIVIVSDLRSSVSYPCRLDFHSTTFQTYGVDPSNRTPREVITVSFSSLGFFNYWLATSLSLLTRYRTHVVDIFFPLWPIILFWAPQHYGGFPNLLKAWERNPTSMHYLLCLMHLSPAIDMINSMRLLCCYLYVYLFPLLLTPSLWSADSHCVQFVSAWR